MAFEKCITIIGGGFSGTLTAVQLLRQSPFPVSVRVINTGYPVARGVAYSSADSLHLLNVRAARMSAFPQLPMHFVNWLQKQPDAAEYCRPGENLAEAFVPRQVFGRYLEAVLQHAMENVPAGSRLEIIEDEALAVESLPQKRYQILLKNRPPVKTEKIVLALGNFPPETLTGVSAEAVEKKMYSENPWLAEVTENLDPAEPVLLVGTGLTMVDVVLSLLEKGFKSKIYAVSTKGYLPMVHRPCKPYPDIRNELKPPYKLTELYPLVKKHIRQAIAQGSSCEALIDSLRHQTQEIWQGLDAADKERFLRHLGSLWGIFRHRISPQVADRLSAALQSKQLEIMAGRLQKAEVVSDSLQAEISLRAPRQPGILTVQRLINCTGPQTNYAGIASPLIQNLLSQNLIVPHNLRLGLKALPDGRLEQPDGKPSDALFTIGPALRGTLWESTAVPEISEQAAHLAQTILHGFLPGAETKTENTAAVPEK